MDDYDEIKSIGHPVCNILCKQKEPSFQLSIIFYDFMKKVPSATCVLRDR